MASIEVSRVYDDEPRRGRVFLVDRLWPRGVSKDDLADVEWVKDVAPSNELRKWYSHDPERFEEFQRRYAEELDAVPDTWRPLLDAAAEGDVTLLYGTRDREGNNAVVLKDYLLAHLEKG